MDWAGLIKAIGAVAGGVIEASGAAAAANDPSNEHARRATDAGRVIKTIFNSGDVATVAAAAAKKPPAPGEGQAPEGRRVADKG